MTAQRLGGTAIIMEHFDPEEYLKLISKYKVTHSQLVPTMFVRMLKLEDSKRTSHDTSSLRCAIHAAAPCPSEIKQKMIDWWGPVIHEYYAGSEGNGFVYCNSEQWLKHPGTLNITMIQKKQRVLVTLLVVVGQLWVMLVISMPTVFCI
jgi:acyl-CoA synthetase (AMP-forming)/AMP-acid ligase II